MPFGTTRTQRSARRLQEPASVPDSQAAPGTPRLGHRPLGLAFGTGGSGRRVNLSPPLSLAWAGRDLVQICGHRVDRGKQAVVALMAAALGMAMAILLTIVGGISGLWALPVALLWYLLLFKVLHVARPHSYRLLDSSRAVYDDRRCWLSLEVLPDRWFSCVPLQSRLWPFRSRRAYEHLKAQLQAILGEHMVPRS